jgi:uncharacterized membrane protein YfcA
MYILLYIVIGLVAGVFGGFLGLGGGVIIIPALIYLLKFNQHQAQGTAIATLLPPIGLLAAIQYYRSGNVNLGVAVFTAVGFFLGGYFGATIANRLPEENLRFFFGLVLLALSLHLLLKK